MHPPSPLQKKWNAHICRLAVCSSARASTSRATLRCPILCGPLTLRRGASGALTRLVSPGAWSSGIEAPAEASFVGCIATALNWHTPWARYVSCLRALGQKI